MTAIRARKRECARVGWLVVVEVASCSGGLVCLPLGCWSTWQSTKIIANEMPKEMDCEIEISNLTKVMKKMPATARSPTACLLVVVCYF